MGITSSQEPSSSRKGRRSRRGGKSARGRRFLPRIPKLVLIFLGAVVVRVLLWNHFLRLPIQIWDEKDYNSLARNLSDFSEYSFALGEPTSIRPPLYPFLVSIGYDLFGAENFAAIRLLQAGLSLAIAVLLLDLGSRLYDGRTGKLLVALFAFYPSMLGANNLLLTEVLFTFFLVAAVTTLVHAIQADSIALAALAGILVGLGSLTRSVLWVFTPVLAVYLYLTWPGPRERRLRAAGATFFAVILTLAPWAIRNTRLERTFTVVDSMGGRNVMMGNYEHTPTHRAWDAISAQGERSWHEVLAKSEPESITATQGQKDKMAMKYGIKYALTHLLQTIGRDVIKFFDFWGLERELVAGMTQGLFGKIPHAVILVLAAVIVAAYVLSLFLGIFGIALAPPSDLRAGGLLWLVILFVCAMHTISFGHSRYHLPLMPLVLVFAAAAIRQRREIWKARRGRPFRLAAVACAVLAVAWCYDMFFVDNMLVSKMITAGSGPA